MKIYKIKIKFINFQEQPDIMAIQYIYISFFSYLLLLTFYLILQRCSVSNSSTKRSQVRILKCIYANDRKLVLDGTLYIQLFQ